VGFTRLQPRLLHGDSNSPSCSVVTSCVTLVLRKGWGAPPPKAHGIGYWSLKATAEVGLCCEKNYCPPLPATLRVKRKGGYAHVALQQSLVSAQSNATNLLLVGGTPVSWSHWIRSSGTASPLPVGAGPRLACEEALAMQERRWFCQAFLHMHRTLHSRNESQKGQLQLPHFICNCSLQQVTCRHGMIGSDGHLV